ncbi:MAG TPA: hypothetical protein VGC42_29440 [Kofleriaceae bacterium]
MATPDIHTPPPFPAPPVHLINPPETAQAPVHPVRSDAHLAPTEDLDREPDGVPHGVVGLTALFSVMLALLVSFMFLTGSGWGKFFAVALALVAIPTLVTSLRKKAAHDRDDFHPSR